MHRRFSPIFLLFLALMLAVLALGVWLFVSGVTRPQFVSVLSTAL